MHIAKVRIKNYNQLYYVIYKYSDGVVGFVSEMPTYQRAKAIFQIYNANPDHFFLSYHAVWASGETIASSERVLQKEFMKYI